MMMPHQPMTAEQAFHQYLELHRRDPHHGTSDFLSQFPTIVQAKTKRMIADYHEFLEIFETNPSSYLGQQIAGYSIVRFLGKGGMGSVWIGESCSEQVAIKILHPHLSLKPKLVRRFHREGNVGTRLNHPKIARTLAIGVENGTHYLIQELVRGMSLESWLLEWKQKNFLSKDYFRKAADIFHQVAEGLWEAHQNRVVHRDLKPGNILITPAQEVKIVDFGLAWLDENSALTGTEERLGTPFYMSPEQVRRERVTDHRTDIFSFGSTLYEAITLQKPFRGRNPEEVTFAIQEFDPVAPRRLQNVPRELEILCQKALEKRPEHRFQSMGDLVTELNHFLHGRPIQTRRQGRFRAWTRKVKRRPWTSSISASGVLILLSFLWSYFSIREERNTAQVAETKAKQEASALEGVVSGVLEFFEIAKPTENIQTRFDPEHFLNYAYSSISQELHSRPKQRTRFLAILARLFLEHGYYHRSAEIFNEALEKLDGSEQESGDEQFRILMDAVLASSLSGDPANSTRFMEMAKKPGVQPFEASWHHLLYREHVAVQALNRGNLNQAEDLFTALLAETVDDPSIKPVFTLGIRGNLAKIAFERQDYPRAEEEWRRLLETAETEVGPDHSLCLTFEFNLAMALRHQGKLDQLVETLISNWNGHQRVYGASSPFTLQVAYYTAKAHLELGDVEQGIKWLNRVLADSRNATASSVVTIASDAESILKTLDLIREGVEISDAPKD